MATVMGALGFSSCHCHKQLVEPEEPAAPESIDRGEMRLMYGVPTMNYMIRGQVKDSEGKPVKDIRVNMLERGMEVRDGELQGDSVRMRRWLDGNAVMTDKKGRFEIKESGIPQEEVRLMIRDTDGVENGDFKNQVIEVKVQKDDVDRDGAGGWNQGTFKKEVEVLLEKR